VAELLPVHAAILAQRRQFDTVTLGEHRETSVTSIASARITVFLMEPASIVMDLII